MLAVTCVSQPAPLHLELRYSATLVTLRYSVTAPILSGGVRLSAFVEGERELAASAVGMLDITPVNVQLRGMQPPHAHIPLKIEPSVKKHVNRTLFAGTVMSYVFRVEFQCFRHFFLFLFSIPLKSVHQHLCCVQEKQVDCVV